MHVQRGLIAALILTGLTASPARAEDDALDAVVRCRVILRVVVDRRETKAFSGMAGSTFWFRVKEVLRFEAEPGMQQDPLWQHNHRAIAARNQTLARTNLLEWSLLYGEDDAPARQRDAALTARLQPGCELILAAPTTAWFSLTGTVVPGKWGQLLNDTGEPRFVDADAETVQAVRDRLGEPDRDVAGFGQLNNLLNTGPGLTLLDKHLTDPGGVLL